MDDLGNKSEAGKSNDAPIQPKIEAFSNAHASKTGLKKKNNTYSSYNTNQIGRFLLLVTEKSPIKTAAVDAIINLSSAYQFKNQWEEEGTFLQVKKKSIFLGKLKKTFHLFLFNKRDCLV